MPKGPHEMRLDRYVTGGSVETIRHSARVWSQGQGVLERLATALETAKPQLMHKFGPQTGPAAASAFEKVAGNVRDQAKEMQRASGALTSAADALHDAQTTHHRLGNAPASPPPDATQKSGESAEDYHLRQRDVTAAQNHYATVSAQREQQSQTATHTVDTKYDHAIKVMESIHGQPARSSHGTTGSSGTGVPGGSVPPPSTTAGGTHDSSWITPTGGQQTGHHTGGNHHGQPTDNGTGNGNVNTPPTYDDPGVPQGPGYADPGYAGPGTSVPGGVPTSPGGQVSLGPTATSTVAGGFISTGIVGSTTGLTNAMRTSAMTTMTAEEQAALTASRTAGTTSATAAGVAGRGGAVGMTGSSRAGAGGTGRGAGAGAGGRGDRGRKRKRAADTDFFDDGEDWLDDDETSPGLLD